MNDARSVLLDLLAHMKQVDIEALPEELLVRINKELKGETMNEQQELSREELLALAKEAGFKTDGGFVESLYYHCDITNALAKFYALSRPSIRAAAMEEADILDSHRYRWLRKNNIVANVQFHFASGESPYLYAEALDEAIDHNMGYDPLEAIRSLSSQGQADGWVSDESEKDLVAAILRMRSVKSNLMHTRRFGFDTLQVWRTAAVNAEGDIEEFLNEYAERRAERRAAAPSGAQHKEEGTL